MSAIFIASAMQAAAHPASSRERARRRGLHIAATMRGYETAHVGDMVLAPDDSLPKQGYLARAWSMIITQ